MSDASPNPIFDAVCLDLLDATLTPTIDDPDIWQWFA